MYLHKYILKMPGLGPIVGTHRLAIELDNGQ